MNNTTARHMNTSGTMNTTGTTDRFIPRAMSKKELALLYLPNATPHAAVGQLMSWVKQAKGLMQELEATGYSRTQKMLTKRQVNIIVKYLDEP